MGNVKTDAYAGVSAEAPAILRIKAGDLKEVLAKGFADFLAMPTYSIFLIVIYPIAGLILLRLTFGYDMLPLIFPLVAGFALLGPFAAIGLYEISRRREQGLGPSLGDALNVLETPRFSSIALLGLLLMAVFLAWLITALVIYRLTLGSWTPGSIEEFAAKLFLTTPGLQLIILGCGLGFFFAIFTFAISVVSFPMLVDRKTSALTAISTSIKAVAANPQPMVLWGLFVTAALVAGSLPVLIGLSVVLPVLGHATWHLYRKLVAW
jgi:uncharacterized membrane protein